MTDKPAWTPTARTEEREKMGVPEGVLSDERARSALTAAGLIALLQLSDPDKPVWADGCDCSNPVSGVAITADTITLTVTL